MNFRGSWLRVDRATQRFGKKGVLTVEVGVALDLNDLDKAFPVLVRYVGLITTVVLVGFCLAGDYVQAAPGFVAAAGMILYKNVHNAANEKERDEEDDDKTLSNW